MNPLTTKPLNQAAFKIGVAHNTLFLRRLDTVREIQAIDKEIHEILMFELARAKRGRMPFHFPPPGTRP